MLIRHTLLYLPAQCIAPLIQFSSILIWARLLTPADLGVVTLIIAMQELSFAAFFMWWSHYALRFISGFRDQASRRSFLQTEVVAIIVSCLVQAVVILPILYVYFPDYMTPRALGITMVFMITRSLSSYMAERGRSEALIALYTLVQTVGPLFGLLIGLAFMLHGARTPVSVLAGFAIAQSGSLVLAFFMSDVARTGARLDRGILRKAAGFGIPVMMASMLALVATNAPRFVVEHFDGLAAVGKFAVGYGLGQRASSFAVALVTAGAYPLVVRKMELEGLKSAYEQLSKNITLVALFVVPVALGLLAINRSVVDLLVPESFREVTYLVLPFATIGGLLRNLRAHTTDQVFLVRSRPGFTTVIAVVDLICAVGASYLGLKLYGIPGVAAGPMIAGAATFSASLFLSSWMLDFRIPVGSFLRIFASAALMAVLVAVLPAGHGFIGLGVRIAVGAVIYAGAIAAVLPVGRQVAFSVAQKLTARFS